MEYFVDCRTSPFHHHTDIQVATWAHQSEITTIKTLASGDRRPAILTNLNKACPSPKSCTALVSFTIALLPFFDPKNETDIKAYEASVFGHSQKEIQDYLRPYSTSKIFQALAWYTFAIGMSYRSKTLKDELSKMASKFSTNQTKDDSVESSLRAIHTAIENWRPVIDKRQLKKDETRKMADDVIGLLLVEYAKKNPEFRVPIIYNKSSNYQAKIEEKFGNRTVELTDSFPSDLYGKPTSNPRNFAAEAKDIVSVGTINVNAEAPFVPAKYQGEIWSHVLFSDAKEILFKSFPFQRVTKALDAMPLARGTRLDPEFAAPVFDRPTSPSKGPEFQINTPDTIRHHSANLATPNASPVTPKAPDSRHRSRSASRNSPVRSSPPFQGDKTPNLAKV
jgi:hypothetical protein